MGATGRALQSAMKESTLFAESFCSVTNDTASIPTNASRNR